MPNQDMLAFLGGAGSGLSRAAQGDAIALLGLTSADVCEPEELGTEDAWEYSPWHVEEDW